MPPYGYGWGVYRATRRRTGGGGNPVPDLNPAAWYVGEDLVDTAGSVTSWADRSGFGNDLDATGHAPAYVASAINGLPGAQPDSGEYFSRSTWTQGDLSVTETFAVATMAPGNSYVLAANGSGGFAHVEGAGSGGTAGYYTAQAGGGNYVSAGPVSGSVLTDVQYNGAGAGVSAGDSSGTYASTGTMNTNASRGLTLGANEGGSSAWWRAPICEYIVFPRILTTDERSDVLAYLNGKYDIIGIGTLGLWNDGEPWIDGEDWVDA